MNRQSPSELIGLGILTVGTNLILMVIKITTGILGNSYALIADGIESASDIISSLITWAGFHLSLKPPDKEHPYGHGKIESLTGMFSGASIIAAAIFIAYNSIKEILTPNQPPDWFTLPVLILVIITKEILSRKVLHASSEVGSQALKGDAWHHRSDAITSAAAALGISIAIFGGKGYEMADDWAALVACVVILINGIVIIKGSLHDVIDGSVDQEIIMAVTKLATEVDDVVDVEKVRVRRSGIGLFADMHVRVEPNMTVFEGHAVSHAVKERIMSNDRRIRDVIVHLEPAQNIRQF